MTNRIEIDETVKNKVSLNIVGDDNVVIIKKSGPISGKISISLTGNNCSLVLEEGIWVSTFLTIIMGQIHPNFGMIENAHIHIGRNTSFESTSITTFNSNSSVEIGERCMFSFGINVYNTDGHPIMDAASGKILNKVKRLKIGNHVWVGYNATILKNTCIPDDCIVGWGSVVNSKSLRSIPPPENTQRLHSGGQSGENRKNGDYLGQRRIERLCSKRGHDGENFRTRRGDCRFAA
ncbi:MAG: hypothetical protein PUH03_02385 [bacterium]|nr:hypothetical protein [bacterium]MDY2830962.1 hypothetical protein [Alphaproteobacteria bacterium]